MKHFIVNILLLVVCSLPTWCQQSELVVAKRALNNQRVEKIHERASFVVYQSKDEGGYVILSKGISGKSKLLAYVPQGRWSLETQPPMVQEWLKNLENRGTNAFMSDTTEMPNTTPQPIVHELSVPPLLTSHWHQKSPYNDLCPIIKDGNIKTVAGCVAIAAAQIVYYWRDYLPEALLKDTPTYPYGLAPVEVSIPKGTPNNWDLILDEYNKTSPQASRDAVAQLVYAIGTTSYLDYGSSTGGSTEYAATAIYLQFRLVSESEHKSAHSQESWDSLLYANLISGSPILYSGHEPENSSGHAVVVDGYDAELGLYHFNFGWGGSGDGYYTVDDSTGMDGYCDQMFCVCNIHPESLDYIDDTFILPQTGSKDIYDIFGRRHNQLIPGINIIGGKKVFLPCR